MALNILLQGFCPMKIKIFRFPNGFRLIIFDSRKFWVINTSKSFFAVLEKCPGQWRLEVTTLKKK